MSQPILIIKLGGAVIDDAAARATVLRSIASHTGPKVVVHGGGMVATEMASRLGIETTMIEGRRVTDAESLQVVTMVYAGLINKTLVAELQCLGVNALGLSGVDADLLRAHKRQHPSIDYGYVGDINSVNTTILHTLLEQKIVPVVAPLTHDGQGQLLNINADTIATRIATALHSSNPVELILCFDKAGVLSNPEDENSVIPVLRRDEYARQRDKGNITRGMIAKCDNAFAAAALGIPVRLCSYADFSSGTLIEHS